MVATPFSFFPLGGEICLCLHDSDGVVASTRRVLGSDCMGVTHKLYIMYIVSPNW